MFKRGKYIKRSEKLCTHDWDSFNPPPYAYLLYIDHNISCLIFISTFLVPQKYVNSTLCFGIRAYLYWLIYFSSTDTTTQTCRKTLPWLGMSL